jgi:hypothetical protein
MSLGYCQVSTVSLNPSVNDRQLIDSSIPSRIKLVGFSVGVTRVDSSSVPANTVQRFKLFDGSSSDPFWTIPFTRPTFVNIAYQPSLFIVTDDSYLEIENGLNYEVTSGELADASNPFLVNVFYIG